MKPLIDIVPHQPQWAAEFAALAAGIRAALGPLALRIDHIGSTSIPGLAAKDVIDIQVTVERLEERVERGLGAAGYERRSHIAQDHIPPGASGDPGEWTKWIFRERAGRRVNLHVRVARRANQRYPLLFRDYLRGHAPAREAYAQVKLALARLHPDDIEAYYDVKDPVCDIIMAAAGAWAASSGWQQGPSDA
jgi:GrpB-like predicted nucleotidyltransferase (UPF0157 family)